MGQRGVNPCGLSLSSASLATWRVSLTLSPALTKFGLFRTVPDSLRVQVHPGDFRSALSTGPEEEFQKRKKGARPFPTLPRGALAPRRGYFFLFPPFFFPFSTLFLFILYHFVYIKLYEPGKEGFK